MRLELKMAGSELEIDRAGKSYRGHRAVEGVSLRVQPGEIVAILGPSGSGKTTLLGMVSGRLAPDEGDIRIGGRSIAGLPPERIDTATVFQDYALFPHLSVIDNVGFGLRVRGIPKEVAREQALKMLDVVGLSDYAGRSVLQLSGGQRQRVATARALAVRPSILLLDEPLGALDRQIRGRLQQELSALLRRLHVTALLVTHDQEEAFAMADRIAIMRAGRLEQAGAPTELYRWPASEFVATFLGSGTVFDGIAGQTSGEAVAVGVAGAVIAARTRKAAEGPVRLLVRPEDFILSPAGQAPAPTWRAAEVTAVAETGGLTRLTLSLGGTSAEVAELGLPRYRPGERVDCTVTPGAAVVV
ncbi:ABC transporter ATP-binding protein [Pseudoxanthobacter sp.]|uniref:ABC transporter ATP-binding protein n=1 Tax=Pseudoxanthobacter sp. TaxID=1925742 RepID=UPI002FE3CA45